MAVGQSLSLPNEVHLLEHTGDNNFIVCQKILQAADNELLKKAVSAGKDNNNRHILLSQDIKNSEKHFITV